MDTGNKAFVPFNENLIIMFEFAMCSLELEIKLGKKNKIYSRTTYLAIFFHNVTETQHFFLFGLIWSGEKMGSIG
jgi:hypothetical protein